MTRQLLEISMSCEHCVLLLPQVEPSTEVNFISFQSGVHIHYSSSSKSTGRKAGKIHHCDPSRPRGAWICMCSRPVSASPIRKSKQKYFQIIIQQFLTNKVGFFSNFVLWFVRYSYSSRIEYMSRYGIPAKNCFMWTSIESCGCTVFWFHIDR